jgi:hypothetical protein
MKVYVATRPVNFNRTYAIGEIIPGDVIEPKCVKRLIDGGKIQVVTMPEFNEEKSVEFIERILGINHGDEPPELEERIEICQESINVLKSYAENLITEDEESEDGDDGDEEQPEGEETDEDEGDPEDEESEDGDEEQETHEFVCPECQKVCASKTALVSHMKTHKK